MQRKSGARSAPGKFWGYFHPVGLAPARDRGNFGGYFHPVGLAPARDRGVFLGYFHPAGLAPARAQPNDAAGAAARPNIVLYVVDSLRGDDGGLLIAAGDAVACEGRAHAAWTRPSRRCTRRCS